MNFLNENNHKTGLICWSTWLLSKNIFHSISPKTTLNSILLLFYRTEKHWIYILYHVTFIRKTVWKNSVKIHWEIFLVNYAVFWYLQKSIISASIKTLQITLITSRLMLNNLIKLKKSIYLDKIKIILKIFVLKSALREKGRIFYKIFSSLQNFLELQCLVDDLDEVIMGLK